MGKALELGLNRTSVGLKPGSGSTSPRSPRPRPQSNQRGIETSDAADPMQALDESLNRTSVGLKPDVPGVKAATLNDASIEPAWD